MLAACTCRVVHIHIARQLSKTHPHAHEKGKGVDRACRGATDAVEAEPESIRLGNEVQERDSNSSREGSGVRGMGAATLFATLFFDAVSARHDSAGVVMARYDGEIDGDIVRSDRFGWACSRKGKNSLARSL